VEKLVDHIGIETRFKYAHPNVDMRIVNSIIILWPQNIFKIRGTQLCKKNKGKKGQYPKNS
jgi:hypothetical protein